jgi:hypothetical protein
LSSKAPGVERRQVEHGAVEDDVASDHPDAAHPQLAQQRRQVLDGEARVAAALEVQIAP